MPHRLIDGVGLWLECLNKVPNRATAAVFLDRDGVIVEECHYLAAISDIHIIPGTAEGIRELNVRGVPVIVVTNQSGIGRGYYDWAAFDNVQRAMLAELKRQGAVIDMVLACAYHEAGEGPHKIANHWWRKPNPGMLLAASETIGCNLSECAIIGDRRSDLEAGARAGLQRGILVETGYGSSQIDELRRIPIPGMNSTTAADIGAAIQVLLCSHLNAPD